MVVSADAVTNLWNFWGSRYPRWEPRSLPDTAVPREVTMRVMFTTPGVSTVSFVVRLSWWQGAAPEPSWLKRLAGSGWKQACVSAKLGDWDARPKGRGQGNACLRAEGEEAAARGERTCGFSEIQKKNDGKGEKI